MTFSFAIPFFSSQKMKKLHILNGDSTALVFKQTGIAGDILIWREILSEGPVSNTNLWSIRSPWMKEHFAANESDYQQLVINEVAKLEDLSKYQSTTLWFEFDLVCQINLIYVLKLLAEKSDGKPIFLICPDHFEGLPNFRGLGELNPAQLKSLEASKVTLTQRDLDFAKNAWNLYVANDIPRLAKLLTTEFGNLCLLKPALEAHILRFPATGLNYIEELLLKIINSGLSNKAEIYAKFWELAPIYGMTDLQIDYYLKKLKTKELIT